MKFQFRWRTDVEPSDWWEMLDAPSYLRGLTDDERLFWLEESMRHGEPLWTGQGRTIKNEIQRLMRQKGE